MLYNILFLELFFYAFFRDLIISSAVVDLLSIYSVLNAMDSVTILTFRNLASHIWDGRKITF